MLRMDDKFARRVAQGTGLLVEGFTQPLQRQNAQRVLGHSHKPFWTLLRGKPCNPSNSLNADSVRFVIIVCRPTAVNNGGSEETNVVYFPRRIVCMLNQLWCQFKPVQPARSCSSGQSLLGARERVAIVAVFELDKDSNIYTPLLSAAPNTTATCYAPLPIENLIRSHVVIPCWGMEVMM